MCKFVFILLVIVLAVPCFYAQDQLPPITPQMIEMCNAQGGYCENVPEYPTELIKKLVEEGGDKITSNFFADKLDNKTASTRRGFSQCDLVYCDYDDMLVTPQLMQVVSGEWAWVVNYQNKEQTFRMEICRTEGTACSAILMPEDSSKQTKCVQQYIIRDGLVAKLDGNVNKIVKDKIPIKSCCSCGLTT